MPGMLALLFSFLLFSVALLPFFAEGSASKISGRFASSVVKITALDEAGRMVGSGSGFFINNRGSVATNYHVLEKASEAMVQTVNRDVGVVLEITHADPEVDLVITKTSFQNTVPVSIGDSDKVFVGDRVLVMGHSPGQERFLSSGTITHVRRAGPLTLIQMSAPILPGFSGGPVFNASGEVVAIATAFLEGAHFALPVNYLRTLKAHHTAPGAAGKTSVKLEAAFVNNTLVEVLVKEEPGPLPEKTGQEGRLPLTIYFRNGKKLLCDRVWQEGETLFLVVHGKNFAVGYGLDRIDLKKSFPQ